jgi:hypothetical protein
MYWVTVFSRSILTIYSGALLTFLSDGVDSLSAGNPEAGIGYFAV